jgi:hypothetical protein
LRRINDGQKHSQIFVGDSQSLRWGKKELHPKKKVPSCPRRCEGR